MNISYEGIGRLLVTVADFNAVEGQVCKINQDGRAANCSTNDRFCGVVHIAEYDMASVQLEGFVTVRYSGTAPAFGYAKLVADGYGGVCVNTSGREFLVIQVDTNKMTVTFKL